MSAIIYTWILSTWCVASTTEETFSMNLILINYFFYIAYILEFLFRRMVTCKKKTY